MKCLKCKGRLCVTHTHSADNSRASRAVCEDCHGVHTLVTTVLAGEQRGTGAKAVAKRLRSGLAYLEMYDEVQSEEGEEAAEEAQAE